MISRHAGQAADRGSWLHRSITLNGSPRALMSPRLTTFGDETTWRQAQENRHKVLDSLTDQGRWLDLRFLAALGEPCYWVTDRQGAIQQDSAASRLEMQPRNIGSEFVGNQAPQARRCHRRPHRRTDPQRAARRQRARRGRR